jgi:hypothetical protein
MPDSNPIDRDGMLQGSVLVLIQFDVCEEIRLDQLRQIFSAQTVQRPPLKHALPNYVRYQRPPVIESTEPLTLESGERLHGQIKYYDYGVVSVIFELPFTGGWQKLVQISSRWVWDVDFAAYALRIARSRLDQASAALVKPYQEWLNEDYFIFHVRELNGSPSATDLLIDRGKEISQIVRGDMTELSSSERHEVLQSGISYAVKDLAVIGWNAAFLYDTHAGAETAIQLLEYANSQLLEFRHYDDLLTSELESVYNSLEKGTGLFARWRMARSATKLNTMLLEVTELTEHADNAIKFLSDMFSARLYKLAASKVGVPDYKNLVTNKVQTARELYHFMVDQFNQSRAFFLELTVVIILIIELFYLFRGHPF